MPIEIIPYREDFVEAVRDFNSRLAMEGASFSFPETHTSSWLPKLAGRKTYQEYLLAVENGFVRGGYILRRQPFVINGQVRCIGHLQLPLSEGIINKDYTMVGVRLLTDALRRQPLLYALGMGGMDRAVVRMHLAAGWTSRVVPFYFRVVRPVRFLRQIRYLRASPVRKGILDLLAASGIGWAALKLSQARRRKRPTGGVRPDVEVVNEFSDSCDRLWELCKTRYLMSAVRDSANVNILYPKDSDRFIRLKVWRDGELIGWAVVLATQMAGHKQFGDMKVGTIVDCLALPQDAPAVIESATDCLETLGVDLIVSNQSQHAWCEALHRARYLSGPSNFVFAASKELSRALGSLKDNFSKTHFNRGDGDGPNSL